MSFTRIQSYLVKFSVLFGTLLLGTALLTPIGALAQENEYHYVWQKGDTTNAPDPSGIIDNTGVWEDVAFSFDSDLQRLTVDFTLSDPGSPFLMAKFFTLVLTPGYLPLGTCGNEAAVLYVDATGASPVVTAYTYIPDATGLEWESGSWATGDQICSSLNNNCGNWVNTNSAVDNPDGSRTFSLDIQTDIINGFTPSAQGPNPPCTPYTGASFADEIGFWLNTFSYPNLLAEYGQDGFLSNFDHGCWYYGTQEICETGSNVYHGMFDAKHLETFQKPFCEDPSGTVTLKPGESFDGIVTGKSPDGDPLTISYSGVPAGATVNPANGTQDPDGMIDAMLSWTPTEDDANASYTITFTFTEADGTAVCELNIDVEEDEPICEEGFDQCGICDGDGKSCLGCEDTNILSTQFSMDGNAFLQFQNIRKLGRRLIQVTKGTSLERKSKRFRKRTVKQAKALYQDAWTSTWTFDPIQTQCTNTEFCVSVSNVSVLNVYIEAVDELFDLQKKTNRRIKKAGARAGKLFGAGRVAYDAALNSASDIPSTQSLCS